MYLQRYKVIVMKIIEICAMKKRQVSAIRSVVLFGLFILFSGAYQEDCRVLSWNSQNETQDIHFLSDETSPHSTLRTETVEDRTGKWTGDPMSRLVFYSKPFFLLQTLFRSIPYVR